MKISSALNKVPVPPISTQWILSRYYLFSEGIFMTINLLFFDHYLIDIEESFPYTSGV